MNSVVELFHTTLKINSPRLILNLDTGVNSHYNLHVSISTVLLLGIEIVPNYHVMQFYMGAVRNTFFNNVSMKENR